MYFISSQDITSFKSYAADVSLYSEKGKKKIQLDRQNKDILYERALRLQIDDFTDENQNALSVITHNETGFFDVLRTSAEKPALCFLQEVRKYLTLTLL